MYRRYIKRLLDIIAAIALLPFLALACAILAPCIYLEDKGPVFYKASRLGKNGKIFQMYKFRSMKVNAPDLRYEDGSTYNAEEDPRVTKIGRWMRWTSADELPQILNILKGDMSFIGPRPDLPDILKCYDGKEKKKLKVAPGLTGYSQALHRNQIGMHEKFQEDVYYVEHLSFLLDCRILFWTVQAVLRHKGIYRAEEKRAVHIKGNEKLGGNQNDGEGSPMGETKPRC